MKKIDKKQMLKILTILKKNFGKIDWSLEDPFKLLIATILSQHTSDKNSLKAYKRLEKNLELTPKVLVEVNSRKIEELIKPAGLWRIKAKRIKEVSNEILKKFSGDFSKIFNLPLQDARKVLLSLPGVGEKTADVLLAFSGGMPVFPVDTHLFTLAKRLKISNSKNYDSVRVAYEKLIPPKKRAEAHVLLLTLGKRYCGALKPKCDACPIKNFCPSRR